MGSFFSTAEVSAMSGGIKPPAPRDYKLPTVFPSLRSAKRIAFDLEGRDPGLQTLGPGWRRGDAFICGFSLAIGDDKGKIDFADYYPCRHKDAPNLDENRLFEWLEDELSFYQGEIVGANLAYDFDGLQMRGIFAPLAKFRDVQYAEPLLDENAYDYRLERLAQNYLKRGKVTDELKALYGPGVKTRMDEVHPGHMRAYGIGDVTLPLEILPYQYKELKKQNLLELFDLECRLLPMLLYMRRKGQRIDVALAERLGDTFRDKRLASLQEATRLLGKRGFEFNLENFGKENVITTALKHLGIAYPPSLTNEWLDALEHPFGAALSAANKYDKALTTFVDGYFTKFQIDGRIHAEFHPLRRVDDESGKKNGTVSGRMASARPDLQNIPTRDKEIGPLMRAVFIPESSDYQFFSGDFSQIEYRFIVNAAIERVAQANTGDKRPCWDDDTHELLQKMKTAVVAQEMYRTNPKTDFHRMVADLTGLDRDTQAKSVNFGVAFCMGVYSLATILNLIGPDGKPMQKALDIMEQYHKNVPFVKAAQQALTKEAQVNGYITTILNRRARFDLWEPKYSETGSGFTKALPLQAAREAYGDKLRRAKTHKALNAYTQGSGADLLKTAMVGCWDSGILEGDELLISLAVHDELDGSVIPNSIGLEKLEELQRIMEHAIKISVPTTAKFKRGANWSDTH